MVTLALLTVGANIKFAKHGHPFSKLDGTNFNVFSLLVAHEWVDSAPLYLSEHFKVVDAINVGDRAKGGFAYNPILVNVWHTGTVDGTQDPISLVGRTDVEKLLSLSKHRTNTYCGSRVNLFCSQKYIWDTSANPDHAVFVGVRFDTISFGLVEQGLLNRYLAGKL